MLFTFKIVIVYLVFSVVFVFFKNLLVANTYVKMFFSTHVMFFLHFSAPFLLCRALFSSSYISNQYDTYNSNFIF